MSDFIVITILVLVLAQLYLIFLLARLVGEFINKIRSVRGITLSEFEIGDQVPLFREISDKKVIVLLKDLLSKKKTLLIFINTTCVTCKTILPDINKIVENFNINVVVINGDRDSNDELILEALPTTITYIRSPETMGAYHVSQVPYAFLISQEGTLEQHGPLKSFNTLWNLLISEENLILQAKITSL
ncbi:Methylamine utilization protein MauD [compost metagenome]